MCNHDRSGFILTEVLITVAIVGMVMIPLFGLQGSLMTKVRRSAESLAHVLYITTITRHARNEQPILAQAFTTEQKIGDLGVQIKYQLEKPVPESSLAPLENIYVEKITLQWNEFGKPRTEQFAHVVFRPESEAKE
jgi:type II secretory pathway pseudopilin PulG